MELIKSYVTNNMHYKNNKIVPVKRLILHSVGVAQPDPGVFCRLWNESSNKYLTQIVIGSDRAYEVLPCTSTPGSTVFCWHVGNANSTSIGAEMTEPATIKYTGKGAEFIDLDPVKTRAHIQATYSNAVDIFAQLCKIHNLDPLMDGVILSHYECALRGIGTAHGDPEHLWSRFGLSMDQFRKDVRWKMGGYTPVIESTTASGRDIKAGDLVTINTGATYYNGKFIPTFVKNSKWYVHSISGDRVVLGKSEDGKYNIMSPINAKYITSAEDKFKSFKIRVTRDDLNMRTGPSTDNPRIMYIPRGAYTIVETKGDWGRLKAKQIYKGKKVDGWVNLKYTTKI